jgi:predicted permease
MLVAAQRASGTAVWRSFGEGDMNGAFLLGAFGRDLKYATRVLRRTPVFTATAIVTLALAIGANTAVFSLVDAILIKPLPYPEPDRLAYVVAPIQTVQGEYIVESHDGTTWELLRDGAVPIDAAVTRARSGLGQQVNLAVGDSAVSVRQARVGSGYFRVLGVAPFAGREFTPDQDRPGGPAVTVLSYGLWQRLFNGDPSAIGRTLLLRGEPHEIVGVMPRGFRGETGDFDVWTPVQPSPTGEGAGTNYSVIARVKAGYTWTEALAAMPALDAEYFGRVMGRNWSDAQPSGRFSLVPMQQALTAGPARPLVTLFGAVGAVLLVACVNLAALLLARATGRSKEIATRLALGSGRGAVVRQLFVENLVLGAAGGACGLLLSFVCLEALKMLGATTFTEWAGVKLDLRALGLTVAVALVASVLFGLFPAFAATAVNVNESLKEGGGRGSVSGSRQWTRRFLVAGEIALGTVLLIVTGLLIRTFVNLSSLEPGLDAAGVTTASVSLQDARYDTAAKMNRLFDESLRRIESSPGVEAAAVSLELPYRRLLNMNFAFVDEPTPTGPRIANVTYVTPAYFETLRIPLITGRTLADTDTAPTPPVVAVSQDFVDMLSNGESPIGRRIRVAGVEREIVGVTGNVRVTESGFSVPGMIAGPVTSAPLIYLPAAQTPDGLLAIHRTFSPMWAVRAASGMAAAAALRSAIAAVDPLLPVGAVRPLAELRAAATARQRLMMVLVGVIGAAALLLSAVGVYGLIAHSVAERRRELGVRLALGATTGGTMRSVAWSGIGLAAIGASGGLVLAWPVAQALEARGMLWGVDGHDSATFMAGAAFLLVVASIASVVPALKILRLDPAQTLRE